MILLGVDPYKSTHTTVAVAPEPNRQLASVTVGARLPEYRRLLTWAGKWPERTWAVENANVLGRHLAQWLIARGERVVDVPASATSRVRELSRGGGRKNVQIAAAAAATVACLHGDGREVDAEDHATALALLDERRGEPHPGARPRRQPTARLVTGLAARRWPRPDVRGHWFSDLLLSPSPFGSR
ncbi:transposase [Streptomyces sp. NPDC050704]|uniref:IS110 family transposase n=1 Tax=Streptomyces sp. NPDC050704 TaxID=3157219 RepID=UPI003436E884